MLPLADRRLWLVGIGGAGMSALAVIAKAWGAEVAGSDQAHSAYVDLVEQAGIEVTIGQAQGNVPEGFEVVVSSAIAPDNPELAGLLSPVRRRGDLLAEFVALRPSIVVAGAHGKTTTAAMIAFCLDRLGLDPSFLIGGEVPQLGGNARAGEGWLVAEGDESDRSLLLLEPRIAVVTNIELDHHATFASLAEVEQLFTDWLASLPASAVVIRGEDVRLPETLELGVAGAHNRANAACALATLVAAGVDEAAAGRALGEFHGVGRRLQRVGESSGVVVYDDYGHHPTEVAATIAAARELVKPGGRLVVVFQPHLYSRTLHLADELAGALAAADAVCVSEIYPAREQALAGVSGKLVVDRLCEQRPGMAIAWAPELAAAVDVILDHVRAADLVVTIGAGDVDRAGRLILERLSS